MTDSSSLANDIIHNLNLLPNEFQLFLEKKYESQPIQTCETIVKLVFEDRQLLSNISSRRKEQRQKLATSFNFLIQKSFKLNDKNPELWNVYVRHVATRQEKYFSEEITEWKMYKILQKSFLKFVQTFQQEFTPIFQQLYFKLNSTHKILLQSLTHSDINQQSLNLFLTQTLAEYIHLGHQQLQKISTLNEEQTLSFFDHRFSEYLTNLYDSLKYLGYQGRDGNQCQYFLNKLCAGDELFTLVYQCIFVELGNEKNDLNRGNQIKKVFNFTNSYNKQQTLHNIKALGLQIFYQILNQYSTKSTIAEFDQSKPLNLMQNLVPSLITELSEIKINKLSLNCNEKLTISCLNLIKKSITFLFMNNYMWENYHNIFWRILFPMLSLSDEELRQYSHDPDLFINQNETLVEKQQDDTEKIQSCKTYAGFLLDTLTEYVDGALSKITTGVILLLQSQLQIHRNLPEELEIIIKNFNIKQSTQACLTILQILTSKIKRRQDILKKLRQIFIQNRDRVMELKGIDKCRVILFLCYNFDDVMKIEKIEGGNDREKYRLSGVTEDYYAYIAQSIGQSQPITKSCLSFYQTYCKIQPKTKIIYSCLVKMITHTKSLDILETLLCTLNQTFDSLKISQIKDLLSQCLSRIFKDNEEYMKSIKNSQVYSNICMIKCMYIVKMVCLEAKNLDQKDGQEIMGALWQIFDLFQFMYQVNYGEELIKIFDAMLSFVKVINGPLFYQYLPNFAQYHKKQKQIGRLFYTYYALLTKGNQFLSTDPEGPKFLSQIIQNIMIIVRYCYRNRSMIAIVLLQYILLKFPQVSYSHEQIYLKSKQILELQTNLSKENIAVIYNLWIIGSVHSDVYNLGLLDQYRMEDVYGYHAKVFALAIYKKIQQICKQITTTNNTTEIQTNISKIIYLLQKTVAYLKLQSQNKNKNSKIQYKIHEIAEINQNQKIRSIFIILKNNLNERDYSYIMGELKIQREELKRLLNQGGKESRVIFKFKTK